MDANILVLFQLPTCLFGLFRAFSAFPISGEALRALLVSSSPS